MKTFIICFSKKHLPRLGTLVSLTFLFSVFVSQTLLAQQKKRTYADFQAKYEYGLGALGSPTLVGSVTNEAQAVGEPRNASTLAVGIGALNVAGAIQYLEFTTGGTHATKRTITAGTPVSVKFTVPSQLLGALSSLSIGTFTNLNSVTESWPTVAGAGHNAGYNSTSRVEAYNGTELLSALNSTGEIEVTLVPGTDYNGIYLRLTSVLGLGLSANLFHAYIMEDVAGSVNCDDKIDALSGLGRYIPGVDLATVTGSVTNTFAPVDETGPATLSFTAALLNAYLYHRTIFASPSVVGDTISLTIRRSGSVIDLAVLNNSFAIQTYNGNVAGTQVNGGSNLLTLELLSGNQEVIVKYVPTTVFDRVELRFGGLVSANLYSSLQLQSVKRIRPAPNVIQATTGAANAKVYSGQNVTLAATIPAGNTLNWFTTASGGSSVHTGLTYPLTNVTANASYYVESSRATCTEVSARRKVDVIVLQQPTLTNPKFVVEGKTYNAASGVEISVTGGGGGPNYVFSGQSGLPSGLTLTSDGKITGTPSLNTGTAAPVSFVADIRDASNGNIPVKLAQSFSITVYKQISLVGGMFPSATAGAASYSNGLGSVPTSATAGGKGPASYVYSLTNPSLRTAATGIPPGFSLSSAGVLSTNSPITASQVDTYTFDVYVNDGLQQAVASFTFQILASPLPVSLASFKVIKEGKTAQLNWKTTSETNSESFDVEHSQNGKNWNRLTNIPAKGESAVVENYTFTDVNPSRGENLYRLKMIDIDGTFAYSSIESLNFDSAVAAKLYPNPIVSTETLNIGIDDWSIVKSVKIISATGKIVFESRASLATGVKTDQLGSGLYMVQILGTDGKTNSYKFVKL